MIRELHSHRIVPVQNLGASPRKMPNKTNTDPGGACLRGNQSLKRINETTVLIPPWDEGVKLLPHHLGNRWETGARGVSA